MVIDLHAVGDDSGMSDWGRLVNSENAPKAIVRVGNIWADYLEEALLYRFVPHFSISASHFLEPSPFLDSFYWFRSWETGDTSGIWRPGAGMIYSAPRPPGTAVRLDQMPPPDYHYAFPEIIATIQNAIEMNRLRPIYTLVPFVGYAPQEAATATREIHQPFIFLQNTGIETLDGGHLTAEGRDKVTESLFLQLRGQKLDSLITPSRSLGESVTRPK